MAAQQQQIATLTIRLTQLETRGIGRPGEATR